MPELQTGSTITRPTSTNQARVVAQGGWVTPPDTNFGADVIHLDATLTDLTPQDPLQPMKLGSYTLQIHRGEFHMSDESATAMARYLLAAAGQGHGLTDPKVYFQRNGKVRIAAGLKKGGITWPVSVEFKVGRHDGNTLRVQPQLSLVHRLAGGLTGRDFVAEVAKKVPGARVASDGSVLVDLRKVPELTTTLQDVKVEKGQLVVKLKESGKPDYKAEKRKGVSQWVEVDVRGELSVPEGNLKNARALAENGAEDRYPIYLNYVPRGVRMHLERGDLVVTESAIVAALADSVPEFKLKSARFQGTTLNISGHYMTPVSALGGLFGLMFGGARGMVQGIRDGRNAPDLGVPVTAKLHFDLTPEGKIRITPDTGDLLAKPLRRALLALPGAVSSGDGVVMNLEKVANLHTPRPRSLKEDRGRLVIQH
jgi:hypothetical protein